MLASQEGIRGMYKGLALNRKWSSPAPLSQLTISSAPFPPIASLILAPPPPPLFPLLPFSLPPSTLAQAESNPPLSPHSVAG
jgi:hypothetical protein